MDKNTKIKYLIISIIVIIIFLIPALKGLISSNNNLQNSKNKAELLKNNKTISSETIINEIAETIKSKDISKLKQYAITDCKYYDNNNKEQDLTIFLNNIENYNSEYFIEHRENSINDEETYIIYWNKTDGILNKTDIAYCKQKIIIILQEVVEKDVITYKIKQINIQNN